jgi:beta-hydroxylase
MADKRERLTELLYKLLAAVELQVLRFSPIPATALIDTSTFSWAADLEQRTPEILREIDGILLEDSLRWYPSPGCTNTDNAAKPPEWRPIYLYSYGKWWPDIPAKCPITGQLLRSIPDLLTVFVAILEPGGRVVPHRGLWRGQIRYVLSLYVPEKSDCCALDVNGCIQPFEQGKGFMFDDGFIHSAHNTTDERRIALMVTVLRPFQQPLSSVNRALFRCLGRVNAWLPDSTGATSTAVRRFRTWLPGSPDSGAVPASICESRRV